MRESEKKFCETCPKHNNCGYAVRGMEEKCIDLAAFSDGYDVAVEKALDWAKARLTDRGFNDFKRYMDS